jgi:predicted nucleic acid-binding protein
MIRIGIDTSVLIGLLDPKDIWHTPAKALKQALIAGEANIAVVDCVLAEAISTIALSCRHREIPLIASSDQDFDRVPWLRRIAAPTDLV